MAIPNARKWYKTVGPHFDVNETLNAMPGVLGSRAEEDDDDEELEGHCCEPS